MAVSRVYTEAVVVCTNISLQLRRFTLPTLNQLRLPGIRGLISQVIYQESVLSLLIHNNYLSMVKYLGMSLAVIVITVHCQWSLQTVCDHLSG